MILKWPLKLGHWHRKIITIYLLSSYLIIKASLCNTPPVSPCRALDENSCFFLRSQFVTCVGKKIFSDVRVICKLYNESNKYMPELCQIVVVYQVGNFHCRNWGSCKKHFTRCDIHGGVCSAEQSISFLGVRSWHPFSCFKCKLRWEISCRLVFLSCVIHRSIKERWFIRRALYPHGCCWHIEGDVFWKGLVW